MPNPNQSLEDTIRLEGKIGEYCEIKNQRDEFEGFSFGVTSKDGTHYFVRYAPSQENIRDAEDLLSKIKSMIPPVTSKWMVWVSLNLRKGESNGVYNAVPPVSVYNSDPSKKS